MVKIKLGQTKSACTSTDQLEDVSTDKATDLDQEIDEDKGKITYPFDPEKIDVIPQNRTIDLLLTRLRENELNLSPDFQRRSNLWNDQQKSGLLESILLRIPIPSFYFSEDKEGDYTVVDGLQRLCAITHFVDFSALNKAVDAKLTPLRLQGLESLKEFEGKSFDELPRPLQRRISETELILNIIRASTPADVKFNIFSRINRGGLPLTSQEIRNAIYKGEWRTVIHRLAKNEKFLKATENRVPTERMEDLELMLRFVAHYHILKQKKSRLDDENLDSFLNDFVVKESVKISQTDWRKIEDAFQKAMVFAPHIFGKIAFRKYSEPDQPRKPINRGLFEAESVALACKTPKECAALMKKKDAIITRFKYYFINDEEFTRALLYATGRGSSSNKRFEVMNKIFNEVLR